MARRHASRMLATVVFVDVVGSTDVAREAGDRRWRGLRTAFLRLVRRQLKRFGGTEVDTAGDGVFATFSGQEDAIRCACSIVDGVREFGLEVRAGVHVGQVDRVGQTSGGITVHTGARIMGAAGAGEVLVSGVLKELVGGSEIEFEDAGVHELKGIPGDVHLWRVCTVDGKPMPAPLDAGEARARRAAVESPPLLSRRRGRLGLVVAGCAVAVASVAGVLLLSSRGSATGSVTLVPDSLVQINAHSGKVVGDVPLPNPQGTQPAAVPPRQIWTLNPSGQVITIVGTSQSPPAVSTVGGFGFASNGQSGFALVYAYHQVWVTSPTSVVRMDPIMDTAQGSTRIPGGPTLLAAGLGKVWVLTTNDRLYALDPHTRKARLVTTTPPGTNGIAAGENAFWISNYPANTVWKITRQGTIQTIPVGVGPAGIGVGFGYVWVSNTASNTVTRIDPSTGQVKDTIPTCPRQETSIVVSDIEPGPDGNMWVTCATAHTIAKINPLTNHVTRIPLHSSSYPSDLTTAYGSIWVTLQGIGAERCVKVSGSATRCSA